MKIEIAYPPNIEKIDAILVTKDKKVYYCYGDTIFNPFNLDIPGLINAHESAHCASQGSDPEGWWDMYLTDIGFRYQEELDGHQAEMSYQLNMTKDRNQKSSIIMKTALRLCSPIYDYNKTTTQAIKDLKAFKRSK